MAKKRLTLQNVTETNHNNYFSEPRTNLFGEQYTMCLLCGDEFYGVRSKDLYKHFKLIHTKGEKQWDLK